MKGILYVGAIFDGSGYAEASRNYIDALLTQTKDICLRPVSFEKAKVKIPHLQPYCSNLIETDVQILHLTPENFPKLIDPSKRNIGLTVWETDRLPDGWAALCNLCDELWVPCDWNKEVFASSGVTIPIKVVPHCYKEKDLAFTQVIDKDDRFTFYSIFQWNARKNPEGLLKAYLSEFDADEKVQLVLKTYAVNDTQEDNNKIVEEIHRIKRFCQLEKTPAINLIHGTLTESEMYSLHIGGDCFVLPHRSEGWGLPHFEAMVQNKPVITTAFGGNLQYMKPDSGVELVSFCMTPVGGMGRNTYHSKMMWAEPNLDSLKRAMRKQFTKPIPTKSPIGFDPATIGKLMMEFINE